jgi:hypothetical protein
MEGAFFSWGDFSFRYSVLVFRDCTTKVALGRIPAGVYVPKIELDLVHGEMALFRSSSEPADVVLRIGFCLL